MKNKSVFIIVLVVLSIFFVILLSSARLGDRSCYKVIKINGQSLFVKTEFGLKKGDIFAQGTPLYFVTLFSRHDVISQAIRSVLQAKSNVTSKSGALINLIDLQSHFSGRYLIFDDEKLEIENEAFSTTKSFFYYIKYDCRKEEITKQFSFEDNYLIIKEDELFKEDGANIPVDEKEMTLYYRNNENKKSYKINAFIPFFPNMTELKTLLTGLGDLNVEEKMTEVTALLKDCYGKLKKDNLSNWLGIEFRLSIEKDINFK
jgi:hypothetical protein